MNNSRVLQQVFLLLALLTVLCGSRAEVLETIFAEDWESGQGDWDVSNGVWEVGTPTSGPSSCT